MRRKLLIIIAAFVGVILVAVVTFYAWMSTLPDLDDELAAWEAVAGASTLRDLAPAPVADEQNAAVLYTRAFGVLDALTDEQHMTLRGAEPAIVRELVPIIDSVTDAIEYAHEAAALPSCVWDDGFYTGGFTIIRPHLKPMRNLALLLAADAIVRAEQDDLAGAARDLETIHALAGHINDGALILDFLVATAIDALAYDRARDIFASRALPGDALLTTYRNRDYSAMLRRSLLGEGTMGLHAFTDPAALGRAVPRGPIGALLRHDQAYYISQMREYVDALDSGAQVDALPREESPKWAMTTRILMPALERTFGQARFSELQRSLAQTALALRQYRAEQGAYPESWDMPVDPVTGDRMLYERTEEGFRISGTSGEPGPPPWEWR